MTFNRAHVDSRVRYMEALQRPDVAPLNWVWGVANAEGHVHWVPIQPQALYCWRKKDALRNRVLQRAWARRTICPI